MKLLGLLVLLLLLFSLTFTSVSRFFRPSSEKEETATTDPRSQAQVEVIETEKDAENGEKIAGLQELVASIQAQIDQLQTDSTTTVELPSTQEDVAPATISHTLYNAYENLQYYDHIDTTADSSLLTRQEITSNFLSATAKLTDLSDVTDTDLSSGEVLKWDGTQWASGSDNNTEYNARNGIELSSGYFELGGGLSKNTTIDLNSYSFTLTDGNVTVNNSLYAASLYQNGNQVCDTSGNCGVGSGSMSWILAGDAGSNQTINDTETVTFAGGNGLTSVASAINTLTFAVGAGNGISVAADSVAVNQSYAFNWTGAQSWAAAADFNSDVSFADTSLVFDGAATNLDFSGDFSVNTTALFVQKSDGNVGIGNSSPGYALDVTGMINASSGIKTADDLYVGSIGLNDTASPLTSGASLIGVNDEFSNSSATNVQAVLKELDTAISGSSHAPVTLGGSYDYLDLTGQQITLLQLDLTTDVTGILPLANGGTNADLSAVSTGGLIYKGASALEGSGSLTGVLKGNGSSAPTAMTGTQHYVTRWIDANSLGTGVLYDNATNVGISTTSPGAKLDVVGGNIRADGDVLAGDLHLGYDDLSATITTTDVDEALTIDPNGTGSIYLHGATYYIDANGLIYTSGLATTGFTLTAGELRADVFRDGNSAYYLQPADTAISAVFAGNVGIGTTTPDFALQVNGVIAPETANQDIGTSSLRWDIFANELNADSTVTLSGLIAGTDNTVLVLNGSNQVVTDEIDTRVWGTSLVDGSGTAGYVSYWLDSDTLTAEQYLSTARGGLGGDVTAAGAGELLYSTGTNSYKSLPIGTAGYVLVSNGAAPPSWIDSGALGGSYWGKIAGVLSPALAEPIAATSAATTVATFTANGSNTALQAGGSAAYARFDNTGNLVFTNGSGSSIDSSGTLSIGGSTQTGLALGRVGASTSIANLTTNGVVYTSGGNGTLNTETQLAITRGGTNSTATPTSGAVAYGTGTAYAFSLAGTSGQALLSGGAGTPTWGTLGLAYGGTNANLSAVATGGLIYKGATALEGTGALTGILKGNGAAAPTALTGLTNYVTRWTDTNTLGTGILYDDGTNIGIGTTSPDFALQVNGVVAPEISGLDLGTTGLRWNVYGGSINANSTVTLSGLTPDTDDTVLLLNGSNQVVTREIDARVWSGAFFNGAGTNGYVAYWTGTDSLSAEQYLSVTRGGLGGDLTAVGAGEVLYSTGSTSYDSLAAGPAGFVLSSGGAGAPSWINPSTLGTNYWQLADGAFSPATPYTNNSDLLLGSAATSSAKFAVLNLFPGSGTPTASVSSGLNGTSAYLTASGILGTQNKISLTLGNAATGNILLHPNSTGNVGIGTTSPVQKLDVNGTINTSTEYRIADNRILDATVGYSNTLVGVDIAPSITSGATYNTLLGFGVATSLNNDSASYNTLIGADSGDYLTTGSNNTLLGYASGTGLATGSENVLVGAWSGLDSGSEGNVVLGYFAGAAGGTGNDNVMIGRYSDITANSNYSIALGAYVDIPFSSSIAIGYNADPTAANQLVIGGDSANGYINDAYFGRGVISATPNDIKLNATGGSGTNIAGANFIFAGGKGTGNADGGDLIWQTADAGGSGTTLQSLTEKMRLTDEGNLGIGTASPTSFKLQIAGSVGPNSNDTYDLGSTALRWKDLYLGGETIHLGASSTDEALISYSSSNILSFNTDSNTNGDIAFFTNDLYLDKSTGNIGIGSTTPGQTLDVVGNVRISGLSASLPVKTNASNDLISGAINLASSEVTGILPLANGGSNKNLTAVNGGVVYSDADSFEITAAGSAGQVLLSNGAGAPTWGTLGLSYGGTNADLSGVSTGGLIYKGATALEGSGSLTGVLKGNGSSAPTALTGTQHYVTRWTDASTLGTGVLYDNGTNVGVGTTSPTSFKLELAGGFGPTANNSYNLGSDTRRWANVYATAFFQNGNAVCDDSGNCASVGNLWQYVNGAISPSTPYTNNSDLLLGSNATASAKFAVLNIFPGSGTPTASVSSGLNGTSAYLTADGTLATTRRQTLTIGNSSTYDTTGNVLINPNGTGNVGIGTTSPNVRLDVSGIARVSSGTLPNYPTTGAGIEMVYDADGSAGSITGGSGVSLITSYDRGASAYRDLWFNGGTLLFNSRSSGSIRFRADTGADQMVILSTGNVGIGTTAPLATLDVAGTASVSGTLSLGDNTNSILRPAAGGNLTFQQKSGANTWADAMMIQNGSGNVGIGSTAPAYKLDVAGTAQITGAATFGSTITLPNSNTLTGVANFTQFSNGISVGGGTTYYLNSSGNLNANTGTFAGTLTANGDIDLGNATTDSITFTGQADSSLLPITNNTYDLGSNSKRWANIYATALYQNGNAVCDSSGVNCVNYWRVPANTGTLSPVNDTLDLLVGGIATSSAKFAVLNVNSGTPTASVSAGVNGTGIYMTADGTLATTRRQTLTIGNSSTYDTTGNVLINPNGTGNVGVGTTTPLQVLDVNGDVKVTGNDIMDSGNTSRITLGATTTLTNTTTTLSGTTTLTATSLATLTSSATVAWGGATTLTFSADNATINGSDVANGNLTLQGTSNATRTTSYVLLQPNGGSVGIGTISPVSALHINGSITVENLSGINGTGDNVRFHTNKTDDTTYEWLGMYSGATRQAIILYDGSWNGCNSSTTEVCIKAENGNDLTLESDADILLTNTSNVGVGTTTPRAKLDIAGSASSSGTLSFRGTTDPKINILNGEAFGIRTSPGGDTGLTERLTVLNSGNIGIGETTPSNKLEVKSALASRDGIKISNSDVAGGSIINFENSAGSSISSISSHNSGFISAADYLVANGLTIANSSQGITLAAHGASGILSFFTGGTTSTNERMTILAGGNIGIGTTNPSLAKLQVSGNIRSTTTIEVGTQFHGYNADAASLPSYSWYGAGNTDNGMYLAGTDVVGFSTAGTNRMTITATGNVGVGNATAGNLLSVGTDIGAVGTNTTIAVGGTNAVVAAGASYAGGTFAYMKWNGTNTIAEFGSGGGNDINLIAGSVGVGDSTPDRKLDVKGTVCLDLNADEACTDNTSAISDSRLKVNVRNLDNALSLVQQLQGVRFNWNGEYNTGSAASIGFLAQEVEQIFPELVLTDTAGYKNLDYGKLTAVLAEAIKEQQSSISSLAQAIPANTTFSSTGELILNGSNSTYTVTAVNSSPVANVIAATQAVFGRITAGLVDTKELIVTQTAQVADLSVNSLKISGTSIDDYIRNIVQLELQNQPTPLPADAIAQNFNSGMVINNYNSTVTIIPDPSSEASITQDGDSTIIITPMKDERMDILATLVSWTDATVEGIRSLIFNTPTVFKAIAWFEGPVKVNADTSGTITVPASTLKARVSFTAAFPEVPTIYVSFSNSSPVPHTISDINKYGFTINFESAPGREISMQWLALLRDDTGTTPSLEVLETAGDQPAPTPTPTPEPTPQPSATPDPTITPEASPTPSPDASPAPDSTALGDLMVSPEATASSSN